MKFYISTYTEGFFNEGPNGSKGIYLCEFNEINNELKVLNSTSFSINPSFIKLNKNKDCLFVACEKLPPSRIDNYLVDESGNLQFNDSVTLDYRSICYASNNDDNAFVTFANYGSGEVFAYAYDDNYKFVKSLSCFRNNDNEIGPNTKRQELPHAHSIRLIEALNTYVSCDLGCDKIRFFDVDGQNIKESTIKDIKVNAGYGPRHSINTKDGKYLYVSCELANRVLAFELINNEYVLIDDVNSLPIDYVDENTCADIHISDDDKYIFVSNRGNDSIGQYEINENGKLKLIKHVDVFGKGPRNFAVCENYIICANQDSNNCSILEIKNGLLTGKELASINVISPVCIEKL